MQALLPQAVFYIFAALTVICAVFVITQNNPVRCVLFLVGAFFTSSVLWMLVQAEFLALILVLVYVGAVMTLFLFVVMMLNIDIESMKQHFLRYLPLGLIFVAGLVGLCWIAIPNDFWTNIISLEPTGHLNNASGGSLSNTQAIGSVLYTHYVYAFELAAVILLVAIIAAITLVHREPIRTKRQAILKQIMTTKAERLILVKMKPESSGKKV